MKTMVTFEKDTMYHKFVWYNLLRSLRFFDPFIIIYLSSVNITYTKIGLLYCIKKLVSTVLEVPSGILADMLGRKKILLIAYSSYILSFLMLYLFPHLLFLVVAFILFGIGETFRIGTHEAILISYLEKKNWLNFKTEYYGLVRGWGQIGMALSSIIGGVIIFVFHSYKAIFLLSVIPYAINILLINSYPAYLDHIKTDTPITKHPLEEFGKNLWMILKRPSLLRVIGNGNMHASFLESIKDFTQPIMGAIALSIPMLSVVQSKEEKVGITVGLISFVIFLFSAISSKEALRISHWFPSDHKALKISLIGGLLLGGGIGFFYTTNVLWLSIFCFMLVYCNDTFRMPIINTSLSNGTPSSMLTTVLSVNAFIKALLSAFFTLIFGVLSDKLGLGKALITLSLVLLVVYLISVVSIYFYDHYAYKFYIKRKQKLLMEVVNNKKLS